MYHKIVKRLDDSSDAVRIAICDTLEKFLQCAPKGCFSGTTIDYTLGTLRCTNSVISSRYPHHLHLHHKRYL
jgi:hypothetical protein